MEDLLLPVEADLLFSLALHHRQNHLTNMEDHHLQVGLETAVNLEDLHHQRQVTNMEDHLHPHLLSMAHLKSEEHFRVGLEDHNLLHLYSNTFNLM